MTEKTLDAPGRPRRRDAGAPSRALLLTGVAILLVTIGALAVGISAHYAGLSGPVLPASWCRSGGTTILPPLTGLRWITAWQLDRVATASCVGVGAIYLAGVAAVNRRHVKRWPAVRTASFMAGLGACLLATDSAIGVYDMALFSSHMIGHLLLVMVAPPLLVIGHPMTLALHATRNPWHTRIKWLIRSRPVALWFSAPVALATYAVMLVGTHLTGLMDQIMLRPWAGQAEHLAYVLVGYQLFAITIGDEPIPWRLSMPARELLLAVAMGVDTFVGVTLLLSDRAIAMSASSPLHTDPLAETWDGGGIMWSWGDGIMAFIMICVVVVWMRRPAYARRDRKSWMEQARRGNFEDQTGRAPARDIDEDDSAREAYNAWLQRIGAER